MEVTQETIVGKANREYKDTVFRMLFRNRKYLLGLYNAMSGKQYTDPNELEIVTLENAIYCGMKNDLAFLIRSDLYLYEQQSTVNPNMPLRLLLYVADEYQKLTVTKKMYGSKLIRLNSPHFVVFYNGAEPQPEEQILRLSDAYIGNDGEAELELKVRVLNINDGFNISLKERCQALNEYMLYVDCVRRYQKDYPLDNAVSLAVDECIENNVLRDFLLTNKAEVKKVSIYEFNEEEYRQVLREEAMEKGFEDGRAAGMEVGRAEGMEAGEAKKLAELTLEGLITREQALERCPLPAEKFDKILTQIASQKSTSLN